MLSNSDKSRLMVSSSVDGGHTVGTSGETTSNVGGENTVRRGVVKTLEELERGGVRSGGLVD